MDRPGGGIVDADDAAAQSGLAAAGFSHQGESFSGPNGEADIIHGFYVSNHLVQQTPGGDRKMHFQIFKLKKWCPVGGDRWLGALGCTG